MLDARIFVLLRNRVHVMRPHWYNFAVAISTSQTYIFDSGARRIALLPAHLHGGSPTCRCGSGSLQVWAGLVVCGWARRATNFTYYEKKIQIKQRFLTKSKGCRDVCLAMKKSATGQQCTQTS